MKIGNTDLSGICLLAPMAGVTDRAFRELCLKNGAACVCTEMVSAKGIAMNDEKSKRLLTLGENEMPGAAQIFGCDKEAMASAAKIAEQTGCIAVDINMGCPAPKVAGHGGGSALMKNPDLAGEIAAACVNAVSIPVTCKIRAGWDENSINAPELAKILEQAGVSAVTVHGRTRKQMYAPPVDYGVIKRVKESVNIPVIGNGDVTDIPSAFEMINKTGCDSLMIGRGALGRPWVFKIINTYFETGEILPEPSIEEKMEIMVNHITKLCLYKGDYIGIREARKHAGWYIKGVRGAANFRREIGALESIDELKSLAEKVIASQAE